jgi:spoIIIJ-associated protein
MIDTLPIVQAAVAEMLEKMGFPGEVEVVSPSERSYSVKVTVVDGSKLLIGQHGVALSALQYMARSILTRKLKERVDVLVDVNGYWEEKRPLLEREALFAEEEVLRTGHPMVLRPMLPYERKVIHTFLVERKKVATESTGHGEERKVIVKAISDM